MGGWVDRRIDGSGMVVEGKEEEKKKEEKHTKRIKLKQPK